MKRSLKSILDKAGPENTENLFSQINAEEKVTKETQARLREKVCGAKTPAKRRFGRFIPAAAAACAVIILASAGVLLFRTPKTADNDAAVISCESSETVYELEHPGITYLSPDDFYSDRTAGKVSDGFKKQYASFAVELFKKCAEEGGGTLVSPLSVYTLMQIVSNGAAGETETLMNRALGGGMTTEEINAQLFNYYESIRYTDNATLKNANSVWMTNDEVFHADPDFIALVNNTFRAQLACASLDDPETIDAINKWCEKKTDGMIDKILEGPRDAPARIFLLNALCFDGLWEIPYADEDCAPAVFHGKNGDTDITMMLSGVACKYISGEHETGFVQHYDGGFAFAAILPEEGVSIEDYIASLDGERFVSMIANSGGQVNSGLPEFSYGRRANLKNALKEMGFEGVLETGDFSGIGYTDDGSGLGIDSVLHKTFIQVDPSGTRAAAVSAVVVDGLPNEGAPQVILDRPFVYAIVDTENWLPVFIGCVTDIG